MHIRLLVLVFLAWYTAAEARAQQTPASNPADRVARAVDSNSLRAHLEFLRR